MSTLQIVSLVTNSCVDMLFIINSICGFIDPYEDRTREGWAWLCAALAETTLVLWTIFKW